MKTHTPDHNINANSPTTSTFVEECWLFHGTSHAAAEGITSDDFDMTRANPSGGERLGVKREDGSEASHSKALVAEVEPP